MRGFLTHHGSQPAQRGDGVLACAAEVGNVRVMQVLMDFGLDLNARNKVRRCRAERYEALRKPL
jgi:hypothetical protein